MKNFLNISVTLLFAIPLFLFNCNTSKTNSAETHPFVITLDDALNADYIIETYKNYNPKEISKSNRTINQYRANFVCNKSDLSKLKTALSNDENIVNFSNSNFSSNNTQGKNVNHAKTKSIRDKN